MSFTFKRAVRTDVSIIVVIAGGTGSGKTYSALRLAAGICGDKPFAVIDTENGRAKHYADRFLFDHGALDAPFTGGGCGQRKSCMGWRWRMPRHPRGRT